MRNIPRDLMRNIRPVVCLLVCAYCPFLSVDDAHTDRLGDSLGSCCFRGPLFPWEAGGSCRAQGRQPWPRIPERAGRAAG